MRHPLKNGNEKGLNKNKDTIRQTNRLILSDLGILSIYLGMDCVIRCDYIFHIHLIVYRLDTSCTLALPTGLVCGTAV